MMDDWGLIKDNGKKGRKGAVESKCFNAVAVAKASDFALQATRGQDGGPGKQEREDEDIQKDVQGLRADSMRY